MHIELSEREQAELDHVQGGERQVRHWRRYQAIRLVAQGQTPDAVADALGCRVSSAYHWLATWKRAGCAGLAEARHGGRPRRLDGAAERELEGLLARAPQSEGEQATTWTVPLLHAHLVRRGYVLSAHTLRRALHRLGWRWKRPRYELGRPDPAYEANKGASLSR